jgi:hypothetical protein
MGFSKSPRRGSFSVRVSTDRNYRCGSWSVETHTTGTDGEETAVCQRALASPDFEAARAGIQAIAPVMAMITNPIKMKSLKTIFTG